MKFIIDNQLPRALARFITDRGHDCQHLLDIGLARESDALIWKHASENKCIIVSKDEDFLYLAQHPAAEARLLWVRLGNCRTSVLLEEFDQLWPRIMAALEAGERVLEIR